MTTKRDWHHQVEHERIPPNEVHETPDGKTIRIEYREENGVIYKTTKTYRNQKLKVLPIIAERKKWKKFGNAANDPPGINTATTKVDDEINMQFISNREDDKQEEDKLIKEAVSSLRKVQCRLCKGDHWTTKCPYKDNLQSFADTTDEKPKENNPPGNAYPGQSSATVNGTGGPDSGKKWVSQSAMRAAAAAAGGQGSDRGGSSRMGGSSSGPYSSNRNDSRKTDDATVRVTNLPEETQEQDLRDLFVPFGQVTRVFLAKDKTSNTSKGFAFITFADKKNAQTAIECVSGYGYYHLILKVEWANKPQNQ